MLDANKTVACSIPVFHVFGLIVGGVHPLIYAGKSVFPSLMPDALALLKAIQAEKCTAIKAAPIIFMDLLNHPDRPKYDLSSLQCMLIGASTVPKDLLLTLKKEIPSFRHLFFCGAVIYFRAICTSGRKLR
jgi:acyl-CoA synthetase (AMP-forming)/AMP-acid ligase II